MKKILVIVLLSVVLFHAHGQKLVDLYQKGTIQLIPDKNYGTGNDWGRIFRSEKSGDAKSRKSLVVLKDGSVVVKQASVDYCVRFDAKGRWMKSFPLKSAEGSSPGKHFMLEGVADNLLFISSTPLGIVSCIDANGKEIKRLRLQNSSRQFVPLSSNKLAVAGTIYEKGANKEIITLVDINDGSQKIIWEKEQNKLWGWEQALDAKAGKRNRTPFTYRYNFSSGGGMEYRYNNPASSNNMNRVVLAQATNRLIVGLPGSGELLEFDENGKLLNTSKMSWANQFLSAEQLRKDFRENIEKFRRMSDLRVYKDNRKKEILEAKALFISQMEEDIKLIVKPILKPSLSTILEDSDGNLLFFEYPAKKGSNLFHVWVYGANSRFICESRFVCKGYNLVINPSRMVFHKGYLYSLQNQRNVKGNPLRLVRFKLTSAGSWNGPR